MKVQIATFVHVETLNNARKQKGERKKREAGKGKREHTYRNSYAVRIIKIMKTMVLKVLTTDPFVLWF